MKNKKHFPEEPKKLKSKAVSLEQVEAMSDAEDRADALEGIREGLKDAEQGRLRPARKFFEEFEAKYNLRAVPPFEISKKSLAVIDSSIANLKKGKASKPIDLSPFKDR